MGTDVRREMKWDFATIKAASYRRDSNFTYKNRRNRSRHRTNPNLDPFLPVPPCRPCSIHWRTFDSISRTHANAAFWCPRKQRWWVITTNDCVHCFWEQNVATYVWLTSLAWIKCSMTMVAFRFTSSSGAAMLLPMTMGALPWAESCSEMKSVGEGLKTESHRFLRSEPNSLS